MGLGEKTASRLHKAMGTSLRKPYMYTYKNANTKQKLEKSNTIGKVHYIRMHNRRLL